MQKKYQIWQIIGKFRKETVQKSNLEFEEPIPGQCEGEVFWKSTLLALPLGVRPKGPRGGLASTINCMYMEEIPDRSPNEIGEDDANHGAVFCPYCRQIFSEDHIFPGICEYCCSSVYSEE